MPYTVTWTPTAQRDLADYWLQARDRQAVRAAADGIDADLRIDPHHLGQDQGDGSRLVIVPPVRVLFEINEGDKKVSVFGVWVRE